MLENKEIERVANGLIIPKKYYNDLPKDYRGNFYRTTKITNNNGVVRLQRFSDYISVETTTLHYSSKGVKAVVKTEKNYNPTYQDTFYYTVDGERIVSTETLTDRQIFNRN